MSTPDRQTNPPEPGPCFRCEGEKYIPCRVCHGRGYILQDPKYICLDCHGVREIECPYCK